MANNIKILNQGQRLIAVFLFFIGLSLTTAVIFGLNQYLPARLLLWLLLAGYAVLFFSFWPEIGLYLMAFFLPAINWHFYFYSLEIPFIDLLALLVGSGFFLHILLKMRRQPTAIALPFKKIFLPFLAAALVSALLAKHPAADVWYACRWLLFFYLFYLAIPFNIIKLKPNIWPKALLAFISSAVVSTWLGVWSLASQDWAHSLVRIKLVPLGGIYPLGSNQNLLAEVLLPAIFFLLFWRLEAKSRRRQKIINLILTFLVLVLLGTFSRAAWLGLLFFGGFFVIYYYGPRARRFILPSVGILVLLTPMIFYMVKMQNTYSIGVSSTENRILLTKIAYQAWRQKPLWGQGPGEFINLVKDNVRFRAKYGEPIDSHGVAQKVLAENGLVGLILFFAFVAAIFIYLLKTLFQYPQFKKILLPLFCASGSIFLFEIFNTSYYKGKLWLPIAISLAVAYLAQTKQLPYEQVKKSAG